MGIPKVWSNALAARWLWDARREYLVKELGLSADDDALGPKRPVVAFYGPSQVGKTTIILRLLGLREDAHSAAERVLRGERKQGRSATVTALRYGLARSQPDKWEIPVLSLVNGKIVEQTRVCDAETARGLIKELRKFLTDAVRGRHLPENPLWVGVPRMLLAPDADPEAVPVMVDLPGEGSGDAAERHHVPELVRKWLAIASSVVVVLKLNTMGEFAKLRFGSAEDRDNQWMYWPGDTALVMTRAVTEGTVKEAVRPGMSLAEFRAMIHANGRLAAEILKSSPLEHEMHQRAVAQLDRMPFFPVELGDSLAEMQRKDPKLSAIASPLLAASMEGLREHVDRQARDETALLATSGLRIAAQNRHRETVNRQKEKFETAREECRRIDDLLKDKRVEWDEETRVRDETAETIKQIGILAGSTGDQMRRALAPVVERGKEVWNGDWGPHDLRAEARDFGRRLFRTADAHVRDNLQLFRHRDFDEWGRRAGAGQNLAQGLEQHSDNWYMFGWVSDSKRRKEWGQVCDNADKYANDLASSVATAAKDAAAQQRGELHGKHRTAMAEIKFLDGEIAQLSKSLGEARVAVESARLAHELAVANQQTAEAAAKQEDGFLKRATNAFSAHVMRARKQAVGWLPPGDRRHAWTPAWQRHAALADWTASVLRMERLSSAVSGREGERS